MTKVFCAAIALGLGTLALAGCDDGPSETAVAANTTAALSLSDGALYLPAVKGNPGVAYFTLKNAGERSLAVRTFVIEGVGRSEFHGSMEMNGKMTMAETGPQLVPAKGETKFEPGSLHVMAFDIAESLQPGSTAKMTITVAGGDSASFDLPVKAAGDAR